ncbi:hypothetical protein QRD89_07210 [Halobacillus sp. ACCC02827]|uniref:hypothetical protein n=1 Tax=unclassified Halobacillus TaxID=2636472 RepID=UPI0007808DC5|nr:MULTISPECIES: hypothetical protein [unclassified Halobacillus]WJE17131.1 hypothetical protein QRD89_07210 [Halobacillus sp. ACCC02827]
MNVEVLDAWIPFAIMWGSMGSAVGMTYVKMEPEERKEAREEITSPSFIVTIGFLVVGGFLASLGQTGSVPLINRIGIALLAISGITTAVGAWRNNKGKSVRAVILTSITIYFFT